MRQSPCGATVYPAAPQPLSAAMRNSLFPALLLIVTVGAAAWLIRPHEGEERGAGGPEVFAGIAQLPTHAGRMTASAALDGTTAHQGSAPADSASWRVIVVAGTDDTKFTRAALKALGEELTKRGCIAILDPKQRALQDPLPLGSDGCLRVSAVDQQLGTRPGTLDATWRIDAIPTRIPAGIPAARWLPEQPASTPTTFTITHHSTPTDSPAWPEWFAAVGRAMAGETLQTLGLPTANVDGETIKAIRLAAWTLPGELDAEGKTLNHFERIPSPPQSDIMEGTVAFQQPFMRGWIGHLSPVPVKTHSEELITSREALIRRLKRGGWKVPGKPDDWIVAEQVAAAEPLFTIDDRMKDDTEIHRSLVIVGDQLVEWQERPHPTAVWQAWQKAAAAGNADAAALLKAHRATSGLPGELRSSHD